MDLHIKQHLQACILNLELKRGQLVNTSGFLLQTTWLIAGNAWQILMSTDSVFWVGHICYIILKSWRPFTFDPSNLPSLSRGIVCWGWMGSVSNHLLKPPTSFLFFLHYIPPFSFSGINSLRSARGNLSFPPF